MPARYPIHLDLSGRRCLVVGGGVVGTRKVRGLLAVEADVTVLAPDVSPEIAQLVADGAVRHLGRPYRRGDVATPAGSDSASGPDAPWWFVVAATDDAAVNRAVVADAARTGTWVNDASSADGGPAALPAVHRDGPVTVTVSTDGTHPGAAAWLRDLAAGAIAPEHLVALELVAEVQAAAPSGRSSWTAALDSGMLDLIREGRLAEAKERLEACLSSSSD